MLTQADLEKWLAQLCHELKSLHAQNLVHAAVSPDGVLLDPRGGVHVAAGRARAADCRTVSGSLYDELAQGYAAFEQYVDDPAWPQGPWTDVYGMSALARSLILKQTPPDAVQRMVSDACVPLHTMHLPDYEPTFLAAIDRGMDLLPRQRFASVDEFAEGLGLLPAVKGEEDIDPAPAPPAAVVAAPAVPPADGHKPEAPRRKPPLAMMAFVLLACMVAGGYMLLNQGSGLPVADNGQAPEAAVSPSAASVAATSAPEVETRMPDAGDAAPGTQAMDTPMDEQMTLVVEPAPAVAPEPSIDMQAHHAARELRAAEQEAQMPLAAQAEFSQPEEPVLAPRQEDQAREGQAPAQAAGQALRVSLSIKPWGEVFINGRSRGVSPPLRSLSLEPGEYRVRVVNGDLPAYQQTLTIQAGEPAGISHDFESGG